VKRQLAALAVLFLFAHLLHLPPTLEDIDSINFALGVRDFDVARHQPHPPGYPVFIALGKGSTGVLAALGVAGAASRGLALLSALSAAVLVPLLFGFYRVMAGDLRLAWWAMAVTVCSPLFWFTALRPLSDTTGLAMAIGAQALLVGSLGRTAHGHVPVSILPGPGRFHGWRFDDVHARPAMLLAAGCALAGVAAGVRVQTVVLTAPLLLAALAWPGWQVSLRDRLVAIATAAAGVLAWAIPLLVASGGLAAYLAALGTQAGEDFSGVVMLWTTRRPRVAVDAVLYSFIWPWGRYGLGLVVVVSAALGVARARARDRQMLGVLAIVFGPYAVFQLLFHETITVRYALPLVVPVAFLAVYAWSALGRIGLTLTSASLVLASLVVTVPAARAYGRLGSPAFQLFEQFTGAGASASTKGPGTGVVAMHAVMRRVEEWERGGYDGRALRVTHGREWLALVEHWRHEPGTPVRFFADPRRTDLALFDPHARQLDGAARWTFPEMPFVAGIRPGNADTYLMRPPGWMLEHGWALTAEVGGVTAREGRGPHLQPSVAWVRARAEPASAVIGGRNLGGPGAAVRLTLASPTAPIATWEAAPGFFLWQVHLPAGTLAGDGYVPLRLSAVAADEVGRQVPVSLEQFDLQSLDVPMMAFADGWQEPEYNPATGRSWRWMSERARVWVKAGGRDVTLRIDGESPIRYFGRAPTVRALVAGVEVARFQPASDFTQDITIPGRGLAVAGGLVTFESDLWFTPAERGESADQRHLALRIYSAALR
jgi:hypothetical protein